MAHTFLVRYGLRAQVGKFAAESAEFERGARVVIRSHRGTELGEVLAPLTAQPGGATDEARVLRPAGPDDLERARRAERERAGRFEICRELFRDGVWPLELVDVEPLLDDRRTVLHYLGPHRLDVTGLLSAFRSKCDLDVMFEPVGRDVSDDQEVEEVEEERGCGSCDLGGGCGSGGGGCGSGAGSKGGCSGCGVKTLLAGKRGAAGQGRR